MVQQTEKSKEQTAPAESAAIPFVADKSKFLRRSCIMTLVTLLVIFSMLTKFNPVWAGCYLAAGLWALGFFAVTLPLLKALVFERNVKRGLFWVFAKIGMLGVFFVLMLIFQSVEGITSSEAGFCMLGGVVTPLGVVVLRAVGLMLDNQKKTSGKAPGLNADRVGEAI